MKLSPAALERRHEAFRSHNADRAADLVAEAQRQRRLQLLQQEQEHHDSLYQQQQQQQQQRNPRIPRKTAAISPQGRNLQPHRLNPSPAKAAAAEENWSQVAEDDRPGAAGAASKTANGSRGARATDERDDDDIAVRFSAVPHVARAPMAPASEHTSPRHYFSRGADPLDDDDDDDNDADDDHDTGRRRSAPANTSTSQKAMYRQPVGEYQPSSAAAEPSRYSRSPGRNAQRVSHDLNDDDDDEADNGVPQAQPQPEPEPPRINLSRFHSFIQRQQQEQAAAQQHQSVDPEDSVFKRIEHWAAQQGLTPATAATAAGGGGALSAAEDDGADEAADEPRRAQAGDYHDAPQAAYSRQSQPGRAHVSGAAAADTSSSALQRLADQVSSLQNRVEEAERGWQQTDAGHSAAAALPPLPPLPSQGGTFSLYAERLLLLVDRLASYLTECEDAQKSLKTQVVRLTARVDAQEANSATQRERITSLEAATQRMQEQHATTAEQVQASKDALQSRFDELAAQLTAIGEAIAQQQQQRPQQNAAQPQLRSAPSLQQQQRQWETSANRRAGDPETVNPKTSLGNLAYPPAYVAGSGAQADSRMPNVSSNETLSSASLYPSVEALLAAGRAAPLNPGETAAYTAAGRTGPSYEPLYAWPPTWPTGGRRLPDLPGSSSITSRAEVLLGYEASAPSGPSTNYSSAVAATNTTRYLAGGAASVSAAGPGASALLNAHSLSSQSAYTSPLSEALRTASATTGLSATELTTPRRGQEFGMGGTSDTANWRSTGAGTSFSPGRQNTSSLGVGLGNLSSLSANETDRSNVLTSVLERLKYSGSALRSASERPAGASSLLFVP